MDFSIFDEQYYLIKYPEVQGAIAQGFVTSGLEHFQLYGMAEGRTAVSRYYDENTYLANNPTVAQAVLAGSYVSGLEHFINLGYQLGLTNTTSNYDEQFYLRSNPDVQIAVSQGLLPSGFAHFLTTGINQGLLPTSFSEIEYLQANPLVAEAVSQGIFTTGFAHYQDFGNTENRPATFVGTVGNDLVTGFGTSTGSVNLVGVAKGLVPGFNNVVSYLSDGSQELDTLVGNQQQNIFILGDVAAFSEVAPATVKTFYLGDGFATILNFTKGEDAIRLRMTNEDDFGIVFVNNNLELSVLQPGQPSDVVAIIPGVTDLQLTPIYDNNNNIYQDILFI
jgi:hypothetical protein